MTTKQLEKMNVLAESIKHLQKFRTDVQRAADANPPRIRSIKASVGGYHVDIEFGQLPIDMQSAMTESFLDIMVSHTDEWLGELASKFANITLCNPISDESNE